MEHFDLSVPDLNLLTILINVAVFLLERTSNSKTEPLYDIDLVKVFKQLERLRNVGR